MQEPQILTIEEKKLIGIRVITSLADDSARALWRQFMPRRSEIKNIVSSELYSVQDFGEGIDISQFTPLTQFDKWAAVEVADTTAIPEGMEAFTLPGGLYAVFRHKGPAAAFPETAEYIFDEWLPQSGYSLDGRPHFEIMSEDYPGPDDPDAEEDVWIPLK
ncbi:GyrI-like domain-containing protein [Pontibacter sp. CAU 1760]